jgi:TetR/AcrR family transcriptional regulator, mexJK operon transcriptional repressor
MIIKVSRGRPQSGVKRAAILEAATALFIEQGFAATMDKIALKAGVSKQTLYGHFANKEELYRATSMRWQKPYLQKLNQKPDLRKALEESAAQMLDYILADDKVDIHRRLIEQASQFPDMAKVHDQIGPMTTLNMFAEFFESEMQKGTLRKAEPTEAAEDFMSLAFGATRTRRLFGAIDAPSPSANVKKAKHAVDVFLRAYGTKAD